MGAQGVFYRTAAVFSIAALFFTPHLAAQGFPGEKQKADIDTMKSKILESIDRQIKILDSEENCIDSAQSAIEIRECRKKARQEMQKMMEEYRGAGDVKGGVEDKASR